MVTLHGRRLVIITIETALEETARTHMTKHILKVRTQKVEIMYKYFDAGFSESHRAKLYICTLLDPRFKNYNMTDIFLVWQQKVQPRMGLASVT
jgi:hypothetical protein